VSSEFRVRRSEFGVRLSRSDGFTLIELMTVMVIIAVLAALTIGGAKYAVRKAAENRAKAEIHALEAALEDFKADNGYYPKSDGGMNSSTNIYTSLAGGAKKYFAFKPDQLRTVGSITLIVDPFGHEYKYLSPGMNNPAQFDLWSSGPDGLTGNPQEKADDITNWQSN
jgi:general secretion pathway protein G